MRIKTEDGIEFIVQEADGESLVAAVAGSLIAATKGMTHAVTVGENFEQEWADALGVLSSAEPDVQALMGSALINLSLMAFVEAEAIRVPKKMWQQGKRRMKRRYKGLGRPAPTDLAQRREEVILVDLLPHRIDMNGVKVFNPMRHALFNAVLEKNDLGGLLPEAVGSAE